MSNQHSLIPDWLLGIVSYDTPLPTPQARMKLVVELARQNVLNDTGGPFAAAIVAEDTWKIVSLGVNRVVPTNNPTAHAEMCAFELACSKIGSFSLQAPGMPKHVLVTAGQPCGMCMTAAVWAGVTAIEQAATAKDITDICGFDEGLLPVGWEEELSARGITLTKDVLRGEMLEVLKLYVERGGLVYNGSQVAETTIS